MTFLHTKRNLYGGINSINQVQHVVFISSIKVTTYLLYHYLLSSEMYTTCSYNKIPLILFRKFKQDHKATEFSSLSINMPESNKPYLSRLTTRNWNLTSRCTLLQVEQKMMTCFLAIVLENHIPR